MAIIRCRECGNMVSDKAASCPHCGSPVNSAPAAGYGQPTNPSNGNTWLYVLIGGLGVLALILIIVLILIIKVKIIPCCLCRIVWRIFLGLPIKFL